MDNVLTNITDFVNSLILSGDQRGAIIDLYNSISSRQINSTNIIECIVSLMKLIEGYKTIENIDKKKLVIIVIDKYIDFNVTDPTESTYLKMFVDNTLPILIDTIISLDNKETVIKIEEASKTAFEKFKSLFSSCTCCKGIQPVH